MSYCFSLGFALLSLCGFMGLLCAGSYVLYYCVLLVCYLIGGLGFRRFGFLGFDLGLRCVGFAGCVVGLL